MLKNRKVEDIICIDKNVVPYLNHISNFVPILPFKVDNLRAKKRRLSIKRRKKAAQKIYKKSKVIKHNIFYIFILNFILLFFLLYILI